MPYLPNMIQTGNVKCVFQVLKNTDVNHCFFQCWMYVADLENLNN